jgi:hypothetical protein
MTLLNLNYCFLKPEYSSKSILFLEVDESIQNTEIDFKLLLNNSLKISIAQKNLTWQSSPIQDVQILNQLKYHKTTIVLCNHSGDFLFTFESEPLSSIKPDKLLNFKKI